jgi:hypothetical protein
MTTLITLVIPVDGDAGPFNLFSDADGYVNSFETNLPASTLEAGYTTTLVPSGATIIRVVSAGICTNYIDIPINFITTTTTSSSTSTSTTTSTTTVIPTTTTTSSSTSTSTSTSTSSTSTSTTTSTTTAPPTTTSTTTAVAIDTFTFSNACDSGALGGALCCPEVSYPETFYCGDNPIIMSSILYADTVGGTPLVGANLWYKEFATQVAYRIDNNGTVIGIYNLC